MDSDDLHRQAAFPPALLSLLPAGMPAWLHLFGGNGGARCSSLPLQSSYAMLLMISPNTGVEEAGRGLCDQRHTAVAKQLMTKLINIHTRVSPDVSSPLAGQLYCLFVWFLLHKSCIHVYVGGCGGCLYLQIEQTTPGFLKSFAFVALGSHVVVVSPACVPRVELHVPTSACLNEQDRGERLPIWSRPAVWLLTIYTEIWVGPDKLLGGYAELNA